MDLSKCFDTLDHDLILAGFFLRIKDGSVLGLLRLILKSGVMTGESWQASEVGSPQGGVISPLITTNVYLDAFDQFMKERGHRIVRYADDILILCCSKSAAENTFEQASRYLEDKLLLTVNREKTHIYHIGFGVKISRGDDSLGLYPDSSRQDAFFQGQGEVNDATEFREKPGAGDR